jgi:hypothetical protein
MEMKFMQNMKMRVMLSVAQREDSRIGFDCVKHLELGVLIGKIVCLLACVCVWLLVPYGCSNKRNIHINSLPNSPIFIIHQANKKVVGAFASEKAVFRNHVQIRRQE